MLAPILDRMLYFNLGTLGRGIVSIIENNKWLFALLFIFYGVIVFYAKVVWSEYLPKQMKLFLKSETSATSTEELYQKWTARRKLFPKYILVPSHNEMWVKPLAKMTGEEQKLFYNSEKKKMTEKECFMEIVNNFN